MSISDMEIAMSVMCSFVLGAYVLVLNCIAWKDVVESMKGEIFPGAALGFAISGIISSLIIIYKDCYVRRWQTQ